MLSKKCQMILCGIDKYYMTHAYTHWIPFAPHTVELLKYVNSLGIENKYENDANYIDKYIQIKLYPVHKINIQISGYGYVVSDSQSLTTYRYVVSDSQSNVNNGMCFYLDKTTDAS